MVPGAAMAGRVAELCVASDPEAPAMYASEQTKRGVNYIVDPGHVSAHGLLADCEGPVS
jgi:hypothetical protein